MQTDETPLGLHRAEPEFVLGSGLFIGIGIAAIVFSIVGTPGESIYGIATGCMVLVLTGAALLRKTGEL